ncbi:MAG TPA: hypothetical protein VMZ69_08560, partial [Saprospiraceae bacterium]|nr:hypothetical protein [Saprospiraceae bacterium]
ILVLNYLTAFSTRFSLSFGSELSALTNIAYIYNRKDQRSMTPKFFFDWCNVVKSKYFNHKW